VQHVEIHVAYRFASLAARHHCLDAGEGRARTENQPGDLDKQKRPAGKPTPGALEPKAD